MALVPRIAATDVLLPVAPVRILGMFESPFVFGCFCVLLIPFFGRFIWPLAVAGLGFKYFVTNFG
jgi:hypothetical protein